MTLAEYLTTTTQSATVFAAQVGCEVSTITRILRGERGPSLELALKIENVTSGKVQPSDFLVTPPEAAP